MLYDFVNSSIGLSTSFLEILNLPLSFVSRVSLVFLVCLGEGEERSPLFLRGDFTFDFYDGYGVWPSSGFWGSACSMMPSGLILGVDFVLPEPGDASYEKTPLLVWTRSLVEIGVPWGSISAWFIEKSTFS